MAEVYDGFISYSHAADDLLAPRLQSGLQRFAKPWWKRRALRIFRDEASLSANPHLWSSITEALDGSEWFVLLLSEVAAQSEWVNREVAYWVTGKDPSRIIPVVTDGEFEWKERDISGSAAPAALSGVFGEEPRWVDLRWARTDEHLDLNNPRFRDAIADIASAIRGVPKDELESEEVRQHRRTIRTAGAAGVVVLLLGVAATVGAIVAVDQSVEARNQRDDAQRQAGIAQAERDTAEEERDRADEQANIAAAEADRAERSARESYVRSLAANAIASVGVDDDRSLLLAIVAATPSAGEAVLPEAVDALHTALVGHRIRARIEDGGGEYLAWNPSGQEVLVTEPSSNGATVWSVEAGAEVARVEGDAPLTGAAWSGDGRRVVTTHEDGQVRLWGAFTAQEESPLDNGQTARYPALGPDGRLLAVADVRSVVRVWDLDRREQVRAFSPGGGVGRMAISPDGTRLAVAGSTAVTVWNLATGGLLWESQTPEGRAALDMAWNPSSSRVALLWEGLGGVSVLNGSDGDPTLLFQTSDYPLAMAWSGDGATIAVGGWSRIVDLYDSATGLRRLSLAAHNASVTALAFVGSSDPNRSDADDSSPELLLASTDAAGTTLVWEFEPHGGGRAYAVPTDDTLIRAHYLGADGAAVIITRSGEVLSIELLQEIGSLPGPVADPLWVGISGDGSVGIASAAGGGPTTVFDTRTYETLDTFGPNVVVLAVNTDGSLVAQAGIGGTSVIDLRSGLGDDVISLDDSLSGEQLYHAAFSPDSTLVAVASSNANFRVYDIESGELARIENEPGRAGFTVAFSEDGSMLALADDSGRVRVLDVDGLVASQSAREAILADFAGQDGLVTAMAFSPDGSLLATTGLDGFINFWHSDNWTRAFSIEHEGAPWSLDFDLAGKGLMVPSGATNRLWIYDLDLGTLLEDAADRVTRGFTEDECRRFLLLASCADAPTGTPGIER